MLILADAPGYGQPDTSTSIKAAIGADGRTVSFQAPGLTDCRGGFSATIISASTTQVLSSAFGTLAGPPERTTEVTPYGTAAITAVTIRFDAEQVELLFRLGKVPGVPCLLAQAGIRNIGQSPVRFVSVTPLAIEGSLKGSAAEWLVTALDTSVKADSQVFTAGGRNGPVSVGEYGGFYRADGTGFLFGPVGTPIAYVDAVIGCDSAGRLSFAYTADMSGVQVQPGATRWGQQVALFAEPPGRALPRWADWVGQTHKARTEKGAMSGWNSWYFHGRKITGADLLADVDAVLQSGEKLRPEVMHIDGASFGLTPTNASSEAFPEDAAFYARRIAATGARPGAFLTFRGQGSSFSNAAEKIRNFVGSGYTYLKISRAGLVLQREEPVLKTSFEAMRDGFSTLREAAGDGTYLLYNCGRPDRATVGTVNANLIGDSGRLLIISSINDSLRSSFLNGRWFAVDNGSYYIGTDLPNVSDVTGGWPVVRTRMSIVGLLCSAAFTGDPWHLESFRPYWRNVEVMTPPAKERTEVLDLCLTNDWPRLVGHVRRDWGDMTVALLWNPGKKERTVTLDFADAGLDPARSYAVWSFWDNRYLGVAKGSWTTPALAESASQHLCFTDIDRTPNQPLLIGSSLHIYCGAAEIKKVSNSSSAIEIELTDAGARDGDLFLYSRLPVVLKTASGCSVTGVAQAGENAWRVSIADRKRGARQLVKLDVILPVTRQVWFWMLIATVVVSLLFGAWRYVAWLNIQRENALEQERARIARDLHDEIGANLSRQSLLGSMLAEDMKDKGSVRGELMELADAARATHRAFDEIVWSVNPRNDTVRRLLHYICRYAEEFFAGSPVSCRCLLPENLPDQGVPPQQRHQIFLAVKEGLNNILKHASATRVEITFSVGEETLKVKMSDNGKGFDPAAARENGNGLRNMQERMKMAGGKMSLTSQPGAGTRLVFEIPLKVK